MKDSKIAWTHHTFNPWWGCEKVSAGCTHCYAESLSKRYGRATWGKDGTRPVASDTYWREPLKWDKSAALAFVRCVESGLPPPPRQRVFCASMADVFEDRADLVEPRARLFDLIDHTPNLVWLLLTKRPQNITGMAVGWNTNRSNVWLGATVEGPETMWRRDALAQTAAWIRFLSVEPQVAPFDAIDLYGIEWVIQGGESGPRARPFRLEWARWLRDECRRQDARYFLKQLGAHPIQFDPVRVGARGVMEGVRLRDPKGGDPTEWPEDLRVREVPACR